MPTCGRGEADAAQLEHHAPHLADDLAGARRRPARWAAVPARRTGWGQRTISRCIAARSYQRCGTPAGTERRPRHPGGVDRPRGGRRYDGAPTDRGVRPWPLPISRPRPGTPSAAATTTSRSRCTSRPCASTRTTPRRVEGFFPAATQGAGDEGQGALRRHVLEGLDGRESRPAEADGRLLPRARQESRGQEPAARRSARRPAKPGADETAVAAYQRATEIDADDAKAWKRLGEFHGQRGRIREALDALSEAVRLAPKDQESIKLRKNLAAEGALQTGRYDKAGSSRELMKDQDEARRLETEGRLQLTKEHAAPEVEEIRARRSTRIPTTPACASGSARLLPPPGPRGAARSRRSSGRSVSTPRTTTSPSASATWSSGGCSMVAREAQDAADGRARRRSDCRRPQQQTKHGLPRGAAQGVRDGA